ncbi:MAG TPA: hypothetical protein PL125_04170 [Candidatus Omnitrophota bacterium]|nr:hypothetical protein [Candidatus Omnitrophota bacterium]HPT39374.1 hypothetical protein [Candidatus Omnitrophota bacterium]
MSFIPIAIALIIIGIITGLLVFFYPVSVMRIQVKLFEMMNWRVEHISLQKEFNRTKYTGVYLVVLCLCAGLYMSFFLR